MIIIIIAVIIYMCLVSSSLSGVAYYQNIKKTTLSTNNGNNSIDQRPLNATSMDDINNTRYLREDDSNVVMQGRGEGSINITSIESENDGNTTQILAAIDPNVPVLIRQLSLKPCALDVSYGVESPTSMYVKRGCSGIFTYKGRVGACQNAASDTKTTCPIDKYEIREGGKIIGLQPAKLELIEDTSFNENCKHPDSYGIKDFNHIYTSKGCQGNFRYGSMFGPCNDTGDPTTTTKTFCPIGKMERVNGVLQGVRQRSLGYVREEVSGNCNPEIKDNLKFKDPDTLIIDGFCDAKYIWGPYLGRCKSFTDLTHNICPIGKLWKINNHNVGLVTA